MIVEADNFRGDSPIVRRTIPFHVDDVLGDVADGLRAAYKPGYAFEIVNVQVLARDVTAQASANVKIGTTSALAAAEDLDVLGDATLGDVALSATLANRRGTNASAINIHVTTDTAGRIEELQVYVTIRPQDTR
jgi:hypothetical protein